MTIRELALGSLLLGCAVGLAQAAEKLSLNEKMAAKAFSAFDKKNHDLVIEIADECWEEFGPKAKKQQAALVKAKAPNPNPVPVERHDVVFANGVLNDATTCLFLKGRALERLKKTEEAVKVYKQVAKLSYARCWDDGGKFFWSQAEAAKERLDELEEDGE